MVAVGGRSAELVAALDRHSSWISALAAQALAAVAGPIPNESADAVDPFQVVDPVRDEVAAALRIAASTAAGASQLPATSTHGLSGPHACWLRGSSATHRHSLCTPNANDSLMSKRR